MRKSRATGKQSQRSYVRCPLCGMLSRLEAGLNAAAGDLSDGHRIEEMICTAMGRGRGGFRWERIDKRRDPDWLRMLLGTMQDVYSNLASRLEFLTDEHVEDLEGAWNEKKVHVKSVTIRGRPVASEFVVTPKRVELSSFATTPARLVSSKILPVLLKSTGSRFDLGMSMPMIVTRRARRSVIDVGRIQVRVER